MKLGTKEFCISVNLCAKFHQDRSIIDRSSHINQSSENHFNVHKSHTNGVIKLIFNTNKFFISGNNIAKIYENRSIIYHSSHIDPLPGITLKGIKSYRY